MIRLYRRRPPGVAFRWWSMATLALPLALAGCEDAEQPSESLAAAVDDTALEHAAKHMDPKYVCPMHPQIIKDAPGSCPICGMDLVEKMMDPMTGKRPEVALTPAVIQTLGVRTAKAERGTLWRYIITVGARRVR
jgi:hypothetical protein